MADKWADYVITAVRFNTTGTHIESVQVRQDDGESIGAATTTSRSEVVRLLEAGYTFCTATKGDNGKWNKGAAVKIIVIDGNKFIRTKNDGIEKDNLDDLPTF
jgi:Protein of unknown function (DUF3892)